MLNGFIVDFMLYTICEQDSEKPLEVAMTTAKVQLRRTTTFLNDDDLGLIALCLRTTADCNIADVQCVKDDDGILCIEVTGASVESIDRYLDAYLQSTIPDSSSLVRENPNEPV